MQVERVQRAPHAATTQRADVSVNHGCRDIGMPEQFLDRSNVLSEHRQKGVDVVVVEPSGMNPIAVPSFGE